MGNLNITVSGGFRYPIYSRLKNWRLTFVDQARIHNRILYLFRTHPDLGPTTTDELMILREYIRNG